MLVLSRKSGENIRIGDDVTVSVLSIRGQQVRIGITAPKELPVHREEIYQLIKTNGEDNSAESTEKNCSLTES